MTQQPSQSRTTQRRRRRFARGTAKRWLRLAGCYVVLCLTLAGGRQALAAFQAAPTSEAEPTTETGTPSRTSAEENSPGRTGDSPAPGPIDKWTSPDGVESSLKTLLSLAVLSLAPAILLMTTSFVRIVVVLGLLRQALGTQQMPPNQVMTALALFMTILIMTPVWTDVYNDAVKPYTEAKGKIGFEEAWKAGTTPVKEFMSRQISIAENEDDVWLFFRYLPEEERSQTPRTYNDIPLRVLLPAFMLSELKVAFLIGFRVFLPFLIIDLVVSTVTTSMGMLMMPPMMISLPLKLMLFVLVDGWNLVVGMLLDSFAPYT